MRLVGNSYCFFTPGRHKACIYIYTYTYVNIYIYVYIYQAVCPGWRTAGPRMTWTPPCPVGCIMSLNGVETLPVTGILCILLIITYEIWTQNDFSNFLNRFFALALTVGCK